VIGADVRIVLLHHLAGQYFQHADLPGARHGGGVGEAPQSLAASSTTLCSGSRDFPDRIAGPASSVSGTSPYPRKDAWR
jgi:hypothetical protein